MPYWAPTLTKNAVVGAHIFYRWRGGWGQPAAFSQKWAKREADPALLRTAALEAEAHHAATTPKAEEVPAVVAQARQELPAELAKLVEAEVAAGGSKRIALRLEARRRVVETPRGADPLAAASSSLKWGLTGAPADEAQQAPLGRKPAVEPADAATAPGAAPGGAE
jgi:hypothetical protein